MSSDAISFVPVLIAIVVLVVLDSSVLDISTYLLDYDYIKVVFFSIMVAACIVCQFKILMTISKKITRSLSFRKSDIFHRINRFVSFLLISVILFIPVEVLANSSYHSLLVKAVIWFSYGIALLNMPSLVMQFLSWFRINRDLSVITYTISIISIVVNISVGLVIATMDLDNVPGLIHWFYDPVQSRSSVYDFPEYLYDLSSITSFVLVWISSILLLSHYIKKLGYLRFGTLFLLPLIYFLSLFSPILSEYFSDLSFDHPVLAGLLYTIIISSGKPIGGFLFGFVFWSASKSISNRLLKQYMIIAGYGIMILFTSNQIMQLTTLAYPPFGIITLSFVGMASYLTFVGIYSSAICIAQDKELRTSLRMSSERNQDLFKQIGKSHMKKILISTADNVMKKMVENTGVQTVEDTDYKKYIEEAVSEIRKTKSSN